MSVKKANEASSLSSCSAGIRIFWEARSGSAFRMKSWMRSGVALKSKFWSYTGQKWNHGGPRTLTMEAWRLKIEPRRDFDQWPKIRTTLRSRIRIRIEMMRVRRPASLSPVLVLKSFITMDTGIILPMYCGSAIRSDIEMILNSRIGKSDPEQDDRIFFICVTSFIKMVKKIVNYYRVPYIRTLLGNYCCNTNSSLNRSVPRWFWLRAEVAHNSKK